MPGKVLILAYGNPLRGDDGVGWRSAERLGAMLHCADVEIRTAQQLTPELAVEASYPDLMVFIDAACDNEVGEIGIKRVSPRRSTAEDFSHALTPDTLLALARSLYGRSPEAVLVSVGGGSFDHGDRLSPEVEAALPALVDRVRLFIEKHGTGAP